jgi:hypothetical protein
MVALCALIHASGLYGISRLFHLEDKELQRRSLGLSTAWLIVAIALGIFLLHLAEIALFAALYQGVGAIDAFEEALFYSASFYTTAGHGVEDLERNWRLLGASEALAGFLLIGWSTAYLVQKLRKLGE